MLGLYLCCYGVGHVNDFLDVNLEKIDGHTIVGYLIDEKPCDMQTFIQIIRNRIRLRKLGE